MSYAMAAALQAAVFARLAGDAGLGAIAPVHDAVPEGAPPGTWVTLGEERVRDRSDRSGAGAEHEFVVSVLSDAAGFATAKRAAAAVSDALLGGPLELERGRVLTLAFRRAQAKRSGAARRIDLSFRAHLTDD
ncbi:DUF3168 domain-containing protein [Palleronia sediminis]|uniref:DUF3168 domain-containing protein n=1 Tax=Palleronia sediminis TaxID=2547833 RepID=A0A4R6AA13_9RHOB|nr:DUF3168 domain-containing protein [Palleronia sediminis]TDL79554.1 DUF3168 domain-containing protein [Palleronia sediminis]